MLTETPVGKRLFPKKRRVLKSIVPEGSSGDVSVEKYVVEDADMIYQMSDAFHYGRFVPPGEYTKLIVGDGVMMSDTPDELSDLGYFKIAATGDVLIHGLGLGLTVQMALDKEEVNHVTVIEINPDVIKLVYPHLRKKYGNRIKVICADAFVWQPPKGKRWNAVWHDIWLNSCSDNLPQYNKLHRRYGRRCDWQGSWRKEHLEYERERYG